MNFVRQRGSVSVCAASLCLLTACSQSGRGFTVTDSHRAERDRRVGSLGHFGFKASFTDGHCGVRGLALTVGNVSEIFLPEIQTLVADFFSSQNPTPGECRLHPEVV